jgi:hypothetical protein
MNKTPMNKQELLNYYHGQIMAKMLIQEQLDQDIKHYVKLIERLVKPVRGSKRQYPEKI